MNRNSAVLAIIPAYNEAERIAPVIAGSAIHLPVLVIDDGSGDGTAEKAQAAGAVVLQQRNQGKGVALRTGFRHALNSGYAAVITLDADGQHDPAEIPSFLDLYAETGSDLIIGARDFSRMPPVRRMSNTVGRWLFSWAIGASIPDNQSGFRLVSRRLMAGVLDSSEEGFEFEVEMIVTCIHHGYRLDWVPISTIYGDESSHIQPIQHVREYLRIIRQTRQGRRR